MKIADIINGMLDWVRVIDRENSVIYMNKAMSEGLKCVRAGSKCYEAFGRIEPCENCVSCKTVFFGIPHEKEETIGDKVFSVMSSPVKNEDGEITAVVEVLRDTTKMMSLQQEIIKQNNKLTNDLDMAKRLQCSLLPKDIPHEGISFSYIYKPCEALGGDFLDIFKIDDNHIGLYIADVSGHGVQASMLTVFLRSAINRTQLSPSQALEELYVAFNNSNLDNDLYITLFYSVINLKEKTMHYSNAGHNACPIIINNKGVEIIRLPGIPISNWMEHPNYQSGMVKLHSGDRIFFYTDGILEIRNDRNEQYGQERLLGQLLEDKPEPSAVLNGLIESACSFAGITGVCDIPDDITLALVEIK